MTKEEELTKLIENLKREYPIGTIFCPAHLDLDGNYEPFTIISHDHFERWGNTDIVVKDAKGNPLFTPIIYSGKRKALILSKPVNDLFPIY